MITILQIDLKKKHAVINYINSLLFPKPNRIETEKRMKREIFSDFIMTAHAILPLNLQ